MKQRSTKNMRSIEETIGMRMVAVGLVVMVLTAALLLATFRRAFARQVESDLALTASEIAAAYDPAAPGALRAAGGGSLRVTLIAPDGAVLYESQAPAPAENHLGRPEVRAALADGVGTARRHSETMGYDTYYHALRLADGSVLRVAMEAKNMYAIYGDALPAVVLACTGVLALAAIASMLLTRHVVRPIEQMAENLDDIQDSVPYKELTPFADAILRDRLTRQAGEEMRREFTANVSHELKTPLTSISGYAELIQSGVAAPADVPQFAGKIRQEAGRMQSLIGDILQLAELDAAEARPAAMAPLDLARLVRDVAESRQMAAHTAYITLEVQADDALTLQGDKAQLTELCENLVDNAIRYNRPGGHVWVRALPASQGRGPALQVQDDGIGIPPQHQSRVFERFYRVDKSRSKATGGTGLGLAIVKHIAQLHGASIRLDSTEGAGTTVTVKFPLAGSQ